MLINFSRMSSFRIWTSFDSHPAVFSSSAVSCHIIIYLVPSVLWIRICIGFGQLYKDLDLGGQKWPKNLKNYEKFYALKCWMFSFDGWKKLIFFNCVFLHFLVIEILDPGTGSGSVMRVPIRNIVEGRTILFAKCIERVGFYRSFC